MDRLVTMSTIAQPDQPAGLTVVAPKDAVRHARPVPSADALAIEGLTDEEWDAFEQALAER